jgi:quercetin dioxygenase-like cupin family protein
MTDSTSTSDPLPVAAVVLGPGEGRRVPQTSVIIKAERRHSGGNLTIYEATIAPRRAGPNPHIHRSADEAFYILAGEMTFQIDGEEHVAPAGSFVFVPRGVLHSFWNAGTEPATQLTVITPSGIEDYFDDLGALRAAGEATPEGLAALQKEWGARNDIARPPSDRPPYGPLD